MNLLSHIFSRKIFLFFACLVSFIVNNGIAMAQASRPNILLFITDDESWFERSIYGESKLPTPNFDRVARNGALFLNAYSSAPSCAPARAALLSGRNFWELKQGAFIHAWFPREFPILTELLKDAGYRVGSTGKTWGPGVHPEGAHPADLGAKVYNEAKLDATQRIPHISVLDYGANFGNFLKSVESEQPFFFWYGVFEPHAPFDPDNWKRLESEHGIGLADILIPPITKDTEATRKNRANMGYEICYADQRLGEALALLEKKGQLNNTIVIVTADNGTSVGRNKGKTSPYDSGTHVPLAIMWPAGMPGGRTVSDFVNFSDFAPTVLQACKVPVPPSMSGNSFLNVLKSDASGRVDKKRDFAVTGLEWHGDVDPASKSFRAITTDTYAYIVNYSNDRPVEPYTDPAAEIASEELYDMGNDRWQGKNLIGNTAHEKTRQELKNKLTNYALKTGDPRFTGDMSTFRETRKYVQERKKNGYKNTN
ncbi:sulfatase [Parapedobacter sp. SGR-10]|uniref:sulfatase family protein n=1 Tax=Parapedobacter sp. SGR-10 TaxID=2710879 RepID=UPI0019805C0D|nr:sulfatase [Parapedobacter sp. SGR-10]